MTGSAHLRGIVIAGALAALALALASITLAMNKTAAPAAPHVILPLKARHHAVQKPVAAVKAVKAKPVRRANPNLVAALHAGLPRAVARALAAHRVVVVELMSPSDSVAALANGEARSGAALAGAGFVSVNVDREGAASALTLALGRLPTAPAALVYVRPATLVVSLPGFNDRTAVQQAAASALTAAQVGAASLGAPQGGSD